MIGVFRYRGWVMGFGEDGERKKGGNVRVFPTGLSIITFRRRHAQIKSVQLRTAGADAGGGPRLEGADVGGCEMGCSWGEDEDEG